MHLESWWGDLRVAARHAARRPGFTLLVALTLALGLGVNSAVFALVDAVLLRSLPFRDPSRLVYVWQTLPQQNVFEVEAAPFDYTAWQSLRSLSAIAMINYGSYTLTGSGGEPERVRGARVTSSLMPLLGIAPAIGRGFASAEDRDEAPATVILSDGVWRRRFGGMSSILGQSIEVDGILRTVVGVMPRGARRPASVEDNELWLPMRLSPAEAANEISHNYTMVGRLADSVTMSAASGELDALAARLAAERPSHIRMGARLASVEERSVRAVRPALLIAAGGVALLLLVAAANASTLLIARSANRRHELAVRSALGATRWRLLSMSIAECVLFSSIGGLTALVLGRVALRAVLPLFAASLSPSLAIAIDLRAVLLTLALTLAIGVVSGTLAAYRPHDEAAGALGSASRSTVSPSAARTRHLLVAGQIALAVVLLSGAGLMLNSIVRLSRVDPGFAADHLLTFRLSLLGERYAGAPARVGLVSDVLTLLAAVPGVRAAGVSSIVPFAGMRNASAIDIEGRVQPQGSRLIVDQRHVSVSYFETMRIPMVSGRRFTDSDDARSERVTIINRTMARRYFPTENPINQRLRTTGGFDSGIWFRIVGIVEDVRHLGLDRDPVAEMYHPIAQTAVPTFTVVFRTAAEPAASTAAARGVLRGIDANLPIYEIRTMDERIAASFAQTRATLLLLLATATLAAVLAGVAIYGAIWYSVLQRTQEIGIRVALGASRGSIFRRVVGAALTLAAAGAVAGVAIAMTSAPLLRAMLFDTRTTDPTTFVAVFFGVLGLAVCASVVPALRAMRVDPIAAVRSN
ncbi:MAG TPA: ADOP family duplicated permease [Vicinamibacterales bacterium]|nr:ADOP family duplicated permease [Vicinamibacterales bacterium]